MLSQTDGRFAVPLSGPTSLRRQLRERQHPTFWRPRCNGAPSRTNCRYPPCGTSAQGKRIARLSLCFGLLGSLAVVLRLLFGCGILEQIELFDIG